MIDDQGKKQVEALEDLKLKEQQKHLKTNLIANFQYKKKIMITITIK